MTSDHSLKSYRVWAAGLFLIIAINGFVLKRWAQKDTCPLAWDESVHTHAALDYRDRIKSGDLLSLFEPTSFHYPPLYGISLALVLGNSKDLKGAIVLVNFIYLSLLIIVVFLLADHLMGPLPALTAAFLVSSYPLIAGEVPFPKLDLPLTFWVTTSIYCLLRSDHFKNGLWSGLFGISVGLGALTKWPAPLYVFGPFCWAVFNAFKNRTFKGLALSLGLGALVLLPWFAINFITTLTSALRYSGLPPAGGVVFQGWLNWFWYPLTLSDALDIFFLIVFLPGLLVVFGRPHLWPIFLWLVVSVFFFTLIRNHNVRYLMPVLPALAILSVAWLPPSRRAPFFLMIIGTGVYFWFYYFSPQNYRGTSIKGVPLTLFHNSPPVAEDWKHKEIIQKISELKTKKDYSKVIVISNTAYLHSNTLNLSLRNGGLHDFSFHSPAKERWLEFAEFVLLKTGSLGPAFTTAVAQQCADFILNSPPSWFKDVYAEVGRWPLPDKSEAILFQVKPKGVKRLDVGLFNLTLDHLKLPNILAEHVKVKVVPAIPAEAALGHFKEMLIQAEKVTYMNITLEGVSIKFVNPQVNIPRFLKTGEIHILSLERLQPKATISSQTLIDYTLRHAPWLKNQKIVFDGPQVMVSGEVGKIPLEGKVSLKLERNFLKITLNTIKMAHVPIPRVLFRVLTDRVVPLTPHPEMPFYLDLQSIIGDKNSLSFS